MVTYRTSYVGIDTRLRYNNYVSYVAQQQADAAKNTTRSYNWNERATLGYRNDWLEITLDGQLNYQHSRNELQPSVNITSLNAQHISFRSRYTHRGVVCR